MGNSFAANVRLRAWLANYRKLVQRSVRKHDDWPVKKGAVARQFGWSSLLIYLKRFTCRSNAWKRGSERKGFICMDTYGMG
jgi:hypothetical protein